MIKLKVRVRDRKNERTGTIIGYEPVMVYDGEAKSHYQVDSDYIIEWDEWYPEKPKSVYSKAEFAEYLEEIKTPPDQQDYPIELLGERWLLTYPEALAVDMFIRQNRGMV